MRRGPRRDQHKIGRGHYRADVLGDCRRGVDDHQLGPLPLQGLEALADVGEIDLGQQRCVRRERHRQAPSIPGVLLPAAKPSPPYVSKPVSPSSSALTCVRVASVHTGQPIG